MGSKSVGLGIGQSLESLGVSEQIALIRDLEVRHEDLFRKLEELETRVREALMQWGKCPATSGNTTPQCH
ncbi:MAG: hypothetical protein ACUVQG_10855 [Thermogutta sp.]